VSGVETGTHHATGSSAVTLLLSPWVPPPRWRGVDWAADWHPQRAVLTNTALRFSALTWMLLSLPRLQDFARVPGWLH